MRDGKVSASFFTHKLMTVTGSTRKVATLQEAAATCQKIGFDLLHYIPENICSQLLNNNAATRDVAARKPSYTVTCQRK